MESKKVHTCAEEQAEDIRRWAAARAGIIVVAPVVGTIALMANEVYMISRIASVYDVKLNESAIVGFMGSLGGAFVGQTLATLLPFAPLQVPIAVGVTYALGFVSEAWIKEGMPQDISRFADQFKQAKEMAKRKIELLMDHPDKSKPLGDESQRF